jgi:hypothetical protein
MPAQTCRTHAYAHPFDRRRVRHALKIAADVNMDGVAYTTAVGALLTVGLVLAHLILTGLVVSPIDAVLPIELIVAVPGLPVLWFWLMRLTRWALSRLVRPRTATIYPMVASGYDVMRGQAMTFRCFVRVLDDRGRMWHQAIVYEPWFLRLGSQAREARVRRCPGIKAMYAIEVPGFGTLWPAASAGRGLHPIFGTLHEFPARPRPARTWRPVVTAGVAALVGAFEIATFGAGALVLILLFVWIANVWIWWGAAPWGSRWPGPGEDPEF